MSNARSDQRLTDEQKREVEANYALLLCFCDSPAARSLPCLTWFERRSAASLGLIRAVLCYEPVHGVAFSTYAFRCMYTALLDLLNVELPVVKRCTLVDEPFDIVGDHWEEYYRQSDAAEMLQLITASFHVLTSKQRFILTSYYLESKPLSYIAEKLGVTRQRVEQIICVAVHRLRKSSLLKGHVHIPTSEEKVYLRRNKVRRAYQKRRRSCSKVSA